MRVLKTEDCFYVSGGDDGDGRGGDGGDGMANGPGGGYSGAGDFNSNAAMCGPNGFDTGYSCQPSNGYSLSTFTGPDNFGMSIGTPTSSGTISCGVDLDGNIGCFASGVNNGVAVSGGICIGGENGGN